MSVTNTHPHPATEAAASSSTSSPGGEDTFHLQRYCWVLRNKEGLWSGLARMLNIEILLNIEIVCQDTKSPEFIRKIFSFAFLLLREIFWERIFFHVSKGIWCVKKPHLFAKIMYYFFSSCYFTTARVVWFKLPNTVCTQTVTKAAHSCDIPAITKELDVNK